MRAKTKFAMFCLSKQESAENKTLYVCPLPTYPQLSPPMQNIILQFLEKKYLYFSMTEMFFLCL